MKKLCLLGLAIVLFVACQNQPQRYFENAPEIETLKSGIKAYEAQDWESWKSNFADSAKIFQNTNKGISTDENIEKHKQMIANFSSYGFSKKGTVTEMVIDKQGKAWVNYWGHWSGKLKANDKVLNIPVHLTAQFINGKIVEEYAYYDSAPITAAMIEIESEKNAKIDDISISE